MQVKYLQLPNQYAIDLNVHFLLEIECSNKNAIATVKIPLPSSIVNFDFEKAIIEKASTMFGLEGSDIELTLSQGLR